MGALEFTRSQVLSYRITSQGLHRDAGRLADLDVLDLGVQDTPAGSAALALAARLPTPDDGSSLTMMWTFRGAPHLHRPNDLASLAKALWPLSDEDAEARLAGFGATLRKKGFGGRGAIRTCARAWRDAVTETMTKGEASAAVTERIPEELSRWCRGCGATHVQDQLFRLSALPAGIRIEPETRPLRFVPLKRWPGVPSESNGTADVVRAYLRFHGPATPAEVAGFLGTKPSEIKAVWPDDLVEVRVDNRRTWLPDDRVKAALKPKPMRGVRLLPPSDPFLQARDRGLLVPHKEHRKALWTILSGPGALLVDGEIAGLWRAKSGGKDRTEITVSPFGKLSKATTKQTEQEAELVASIRGDSDVRVRLNGAG